MTAIAFLDRQSQQSWVDVLARTGKDVRVPRQSFDKNGPPGVPGTTYTLTGTMLAGQIAVGGSVLITYLVEPVETTLGNGFVLKRICGAQGTEVRIGPA